MGQKNLNLGYVNQPDKQEKYYSRAVKARVLATTLLLCCVAFGCKPKEIQVTGQIFIVTRGAENIKLGAVEVLLLDKQEVTGFFQKQGIIVESIMQQRRRVLEVAKANLEQAQTDYDLFERIKPKSKTIGYDDGFLTNSFFKSYPDYEKVKLQIQTLRRQSDALFKQAKQADDPARSQITVVPQAAVVSSYAITERAYNLHETANSLCQKMDDWLTEIERDKQRKLSAAEEDYDHAQLRCQQSPTVEDYLSSFSPRVIKRTMSDADGRFSFSCPRFRQFAVFANAQRSLLNGFERYYWLIDAPNEAETSELFLSNNNLVFVDPSGFFPIKPKQAQ